MKPNATPQNAAAAKPTRKAARPRPTRQRATAPQETASGSNPSEPQNTPRQNPDATPQSALSEPDPSVSPKRAAYDWARKAVREAARKLPVADGESTQRGAEQGENGTAGRTSGATATCVLDGRTAVRMRMPKWVTRFLAAFSLSCGVSLAAHEAGVNRRTVTRLAERDPRFRELMEEAKQRYAELGRVEVFNRGVIGKAKPVFYAGEVVGHEIVTSDPCLLKFVQANCPEYADRRQVELMGKDGGPVQTESKVEVYSPAVSSLIDSLLAQRALASTSPQIQSHHPVATPIVIPGQLAEPANLQTASVPPAEIRCPRCRERGALSPYCVVCHGDNFNRPEGFAGHR